MTDGTVTASWQTASGAPAGGWYVILRRADEHITSPRLQGVQRKSSVTLKGLIPDADYTISLTPGRRLRDVFGTVEASRQNAVRRPLRPTTASTPSTTYISLWETPADGQTGTTAP